MKVTPEYARKMGHQLAQAEKRLAHKNKRVTSRMLKRKAKATQIVRVARFAAYLRDTNK